MAVAQRTRRAGHAWVAINWLSAFQRLGYDVVLVDRMDGSMGDVDAGVAWVADVALRAEAEWAVLLPDDASAGLRRADLVDRCRGGLLLNVMGYLDDVQLLASFERRVFLDIDPGFGQAWQQSGLVSLFTGHDHYATIGLNVGRPGCAVPDLGIEWIGTLPPVDLDRWPCSAPPNGGGFSTVASWRGPFAPVEVDGAWHGLRVHEARRYADLPARVDVPMEMALDIDPADRTDSQRLVDGGWELRDPRTVAHDVDAYQRYIRASRGEFSIAKQTYVSLRSGWFSDRSACYLAAGRPAIVSDTGLTGHLPCGEGLLTFGDPDEAAGAIDDVASSPGRHAKAARHIAEGHLDGRQIARHLLARVT